MPVKRKSAFSAKSVASTPTKSEPTSTPPPSKSEYDLKIPNYDVTKRKKFSTILFLEKKQKKNQHKPLVEDEPKSVEDILLAKMKTKIKDQPVKEENDSGLSDKEERESEEIEQPTFDDKPKFDKNGLNSHF